MSIGLGGYLSRILFEGGKLPHKLITMFSLLFLSGSIILLFFEGFFGGVISLIIVTTIIMSAKGLESEKRFMKKIYKEVDLQKKKSSDISEEDLMSKIFESKFPKISSTIREEIIENSEDFEEMLYKAMEYDATGKIRKTSLTQKLDGENDA